VYQRRVYGESFGAMKNINWLGALLIFEKSMSHLMDPFEASAQ
jgi:hypothetical protein